MLLAAATCCCSFPVTYDSHLRPPHAFPHHGFSVTWHSTCVRSYVCLPREHVQCTWHFGTSIHKFRCVCFAECKRKRRTHPQCAARGRHGTGCDRLHAASMTRTIYRCSDVVVACGCLWGSQAHTNWYTNTETVRGTRSKYGIMVMVMGMSACMSWASPGWHARQQWQQRKCVRGITSKNWWDYSSTQFYRIPSLWTLWHSLNT